MLEETLLGMNSRSFELLFILRWEIVPLFVSNEKLLLNFVFSIRTFVSYKKICFVCSYFTRGIVIICIEREESFYFSMLKTLYELVQ